MGKPAYHRCCCRQRPVIVVINQAPPRRIRSIGGGGAGFFPNVVFITGVSGSPVTLPGIGPAFQILVDRPQEAPEAPPSTYGVVVGGQVTGTLRNTLESGQIVTVTLIIGLTNTSGIQYLDLGSVEVNVPSGGEAPFDLNGTATPGTFTADSTITQYLALSTTNMVTPFGLSGAITAVLDSPGIRTESTKALSI